MKDYLLLFRGGMDFATASPEQIQNAMMKWQTWMDKHVAAGRYAGGERLTPAGKTMRPDNQVVDGPYAEVKEVIGGYIIIKAGDIDEAVEMSRDCPIFESGGTTEVREIFKM